MRSWDAEGCSSSADLDAARDVCRSLDIVLHTVDLSKEYWLRVFEPLLAEYVQGRTPNPDIECNSLIKFDCLCAHIDHKVKLSGANWWLATGHYARTARLRRSSLLLRPADANKDQTFFLARIPQHALQRSLFPLAHLTKHHVRRLARLLNLPNADRKDSQGLCFVSPAHSRFANFLHEYIPNNPGDIITTDGQKIGTHNGIWHGTIGEKSHCYVTNHRWFIVAKDPVNNTIIVGKGWDNPLLLARRIFAAHWKFVDEIPRPPGTRIPNLHVQIRHREHAGYANVLILQDGKAVVELESRIRAAAPGQTVVVWDDDMCIASGIIESAY
ncbi:tRNA-specific 2-thiouridylase MnmA [Neolecta irregularis DAH-3]|uniref:tRNA-5-taurinomethyluridine 2-sulfurtransferase n=1 Tax=Neolecta irregularis (strain DAH-3) TaxID=1198029 RepID=A0A1U7LVX0_NEOID|nr:tRNA-specific 2-thiouridylase MnmA [Neolecta irregularis DAH-3]|eukprot:OLL26769.1 tRNA-specific 2-thiouridylase MnmA [Neolecta irregularis DAH-3]